MQRSTRVRRLAVAFLVVLVIALAARFARAATDDLSPGPGRTPVPRASSAPR